VKNIRVKIVISSLLLWTAGILTTSADTGPTNYQPGTIDDPVITKSYFDQNISVKVAEELNKQTITEDKVRQIISNELSKGTTGNAGSPQSQPTPPPVDVPEAAGSASSLAIIELKPGQTLYGGSGTELIVRTGKVTVTSSDENGIPDVTSGKDIATGATVELNHLLIVPREGRGVKADAKLKQDIYIMVRGPYLQVNADGSKATP
jgi:hypothetical protein